MADRQTGPQNYFSIRVTVAHNRKEQLFGLQVFKEAEWYIAYPHFGRHKDNEHFHIAVAAGDKAYKQRFADSISRAIGTGNEHYASKSYKNGIGEAIKYFAKERTEPITKGDVAGWIANAPVWDPTGPPNKKRKLPADFVDHDGDGFQQQVKLNHTNIVQYAANFYKKKKSTHESFRLTLVDMSVTGRYNFVLKGQKICHFQELEFYAAIGAMPHEQFVDALLEGRATGRAMSVAEAWEVIRRERGINEDEAYLCTDEPDPQNASVNGP